MSHTSKQLEIAKKLKEDGNALFKKELYHKALTPYHQANMYVRGLKPSVDLPIPTQGEPPSVEEVEEIDLLMTTLALNMSACHLKLNRPSRAIALCSEVLSRSSQNVKALFRRGQAYHQVRDFDNALSDLQLAQKLAPDDKAISTEIAKVKKALAGEEKKMAKTYAGMFDKLAKEDQQ
eukprot:TRINITY_DN5166_c0_g1_i1.p1 TRINITY_DN5166_c0_g1~~TRINITY_DN5166_c0_g1_i1.p1  ORF type:complete len:178 (+),score=53.09 TRINITY_DN5166_c0_g1_i1:50-583(+)